MVGLPWPLQAAVYLTSPRTTSALNSGLDVSPGEWPAVDHLVLQPWVPLPDLVHPHHQCGSRALDGLACAAATVRREGINIRLCLLIETTETLPQLRELNDREANAATLTEMS